MNLRCAKTGCRNWGELQPMLQFFPPADIQSGPVVDCEIDMRVCRKCAESITVNDFLEEKLNAAVKAQAKTLNKIEPDFSRTILYYRRIRRPQSQLILAGSNGLVH